MSNILSLFVRRLESILPKLRFEHSMRVADTAKRLALLYGVSLEKAYLAGLLHDVAKPMSPNSFSDFSVEVSDPMLTIYQNYKSIWHAFVGPQVVQSLFQIKDKEVLDAIQWHTTGKAGMSLLTQVVFVADFIEPGRDSNISKRVGEIALKSLDQACYEISLYSMEKLKKKNNKVHPFTIDCYNHYRCL